MSTSTISVVIVEDNPHIRAMLIDLISGDSRFSLIGACENGEDGVRLLSESCPDMAILDIDLPGISGIECLRRTRTTCTRTQYMMFTVFEESEQVFEALRSGASGYLLKTSSSEEIIHALAELAAGGSPMSPLIARKVVSSFQASAARSANAEQLTARELEILQLLSEGLLYKEIADRLSLALGTVKQHLHRIYEKLHVNNRTEAINKVFR